MEATCPITLCVVVVDELPLICEGLAALCLGFPGCDVLGRGTTGEEAWHLVERLRPDVALLGAHLPRMGAMEVIRRSRLLGYPTRFVLVGDQGDRKEVLEALRGGASGYILKSSTGRELEECFRQVSQGAVFVGPMVNWQVADHGSRHDSENPLRALSAREMQVFALLVDGVRARDIAARLSLSPKTVDTYRASLMRKLAIHDVPGLVKLAIQHKVTAATA
ncbi:MAG: response regulator transcription factor [Bryobacterales bacterium]|nr:response regulator transcription factor [Bryobacterales bacterium]